ncbi:MAG: hypothetical protein OES84_00075 [Kiritimatiellaceae bacterium]|nr:hypothetical protein [Kiritimatiellaceae bacterium]
MAITLLANAKFSVPGHSGALATGFKIYTYEPGGLVAKATYTNSTGGTPNDNPVVLDQRGEADIWWDGLYKIVVHDNNDVPVWTVDNYGAPGFTGISDSSTTTQLTLTDASATFAGNVIIQETFTPFQGADVASASVLTLGVGNTFDVTGTTTITSIASKGVGTYVTLQFDGALTLTHHATDLILGGHDILTAAGDIAVFKEYATGDWQLVGYRNGNAGVTASQVKEKSVTASPTTSYEADLGKYSLFELTLGGDTSITFANTPASGDTLVITFVLIQDATGSRTPSFPAAVDWDAGVTPSWGSTDGNEDIVQLFSYNGGTTWRGNLIGQNYA